MTAANRTADQLWSQRIGFRSQMARVGGYPAQANLPKRSNKPMGKTLNSLNRRTDLWSDMKAVRELDRVRLAGFYHSGEGVLPAGTEGTVVYRYKDGAAYEVEFIAPIHALVTLRPGELERVDG